MSGRDTDVVVIGGGATGAAAAWRLAARGAEVLLLDNGVPDLPGTRAFRVAHPDPAWISLALQALPLWRELEQATGVPLLTLTGGLVHGTGAELDLLAWAVDAAGKPGRWLPHEEAVRRWPGIRYDDRIFVHPLAGALDGNAAVPALHTAAVRCGAMVRYGEALSVRARADGVEVRTAEGLVRAHRAVIAAGRATSALVLGGLPRLRVKARTCVRFEPVRADLAWPVVTHHHAGGCAEAVPIGRGELEVTAKPLETRPYADRWLPGADPARATTVTRVCTAPDFVLNRRGPVVHATGFSDAGFSFLPAVGGRIADLTLIGARHRAA